MTKTFTVNVTSNAPLFTKNQDLKKKIYTIIILLFRYLT